MKIESGTGNGKYAGVSLGNRLETVSVSVPIQHEASKLRQKSFQVWGETTLASGTVTPLHITNSSITDTATITFIRWQLIDPAGGTALPSAANYLQIGTGATYSSGGTALSPTNMAIGSSVVSNVTAYSGPTLSGSVTAFDKEYAKGEAEMRSYSKEGALVILPGESVTVQFVGDHTSGTVYSRISFFMSTKDTLE
jgi:hypothetical protein